jgi:hypothetical protein
MTTTATVRSLLIPVVLLGASAWAADVYVSPTGKDSNPGTKARPLKSFEAVQQVARKLKASGPANVWFRGGSYYLPRTVVFTGQDSGTASARVVYAASPGEEVVISGGSLLRLSWKPYRDGIMQAKVPAGLKTDQLFVNGERQVLARYPNYDPNVLIFNGWSPDAISKERAARWQDPRGGFIHAMHRSMWGDFHYIITGKDADGNVTYEGGWQNNRRMGMHDKYRFVENIVEELDAPHEWFLDGKTSTLYYYPPKGLDLARAKVEVVGLRHLIEFRGVQNDPVRWVTLKGFTFRHAARTFMDNKEPLLRSDWTTYRGGAIFFNGSEDCSLEDSVVDQVGGNAVFVNMYNRRVAIRGSRIWRAGANGVAFVGDPKAVRSPLFEYAERQNFKDIDLKPGPQSNNIPIDCLVEDTLIHETGRTEKQTAGVQISMSEGITVRHCSVYDVPRAGININEGTFGGHLVEFCDVFNTVLETGDHGSFNSWGRDRYWGLKDIDLNTITLGENRTLPTLDMVKPNVLRNTRWRCDHGWDIDLDDGSTQYEVYNNLSLNGGIKLREGFYRRCENNIMVGNSFHPHVWYLHSEDIFRHNIVFGQYRPIRVNKPWGKECDYNLLHRPGANDPAPAVLLQEQSGLDEHSLIADADFVDPAHGDYRVKDGSPALKLGFRNFPMDQFGVTKPSLKAIAKTPQLPEPNAAQPATLRSARDRTTWVWAGATVRNVVGLGEVSAAGLPGEVGVLVLEVPAGTAAAQAGIRSGDVILRVDGESVVSLQDLKRLWNSRHSGSSPEVTFSRDQSQRKTLVSAEGSSGQL